MSDLEPLIFYVIINYCSQFQMNTFFLLSISQINISVKKTRIMETFQSLLKENRKQSLTLYNVLHCTLYIREVGTFD